MLQNLDPDTKLNLVNKCVEIGGELVKDRFARQRRMQMLDARKDAEVEIARARQESLSDGESTRSQAPAAPETAAEPATPLLDQRIERAIQTEDCEFCVGIYEQLLDTDEETKVKGLEEMSKLKGVMEAESSSQEDLEAMMSRLDVVPRLAQRV